MAENIRNKRFDIILQTSFIKFSAIFHETSLPYKMQQLIVIAPQFNPNAKLYHKILPNITRFRVEQIRDRQTQDRRTGLILKRRAYIYNKKTANYSTTVLLKTTITLT